LIGGRGLTVDFDDINADLNLQEDEEVDLEEGGEQEDDELGHVIRDLGIPPPRATHRCVTCLAEVPNSRKGKNLKKVILKLPTVLSTDFFWGENLREDNSETRMK
jgi:hypothetical protein